MKITNQAVPPELDTLYKTLVSTNTTGPGAGTQARTRTGATISPAKKRKPDDTNNIRPAVEKLIAYLHTRQNPPPYIPTVYEEIENIANGIFNPDFWVKCEEISNKFYKSTPTNAFDPNPPPYAYRDEFNLPTRPTYTTGIFDASPARYAGQTTAGFFYDSYLVWQTTLFILKNPISNDTDEPAILFWNPTITINTDHRGSRPMLSVLMRSWIERVGSPELTTLDTPTYKTYPPGQQKTRQVKSLYWRYVVPVTAPPFFSLSQPRRIIQNLLKAASIGTEQDMQRARVVSAPRPVFGRGFNNNTTIQTSVTNKPRIYQINRMKYCENIVTTEYGFFSFASWRTMSFRPNYGGVDVTLWHDSPYLSSNYFLPRSLAFLISKGLPSSAVFTEQDVDYNTVNGTGLRKQLTVDLAPSANSVITTFYDWWRKINPNQFSELYQSYYYASPLDSTKEERWQTEFRSLSGGYSNYVAANTASWSAFWKLVTFSNGTQIASIITIDEFTALRNNFADRTIQHQLTHCLDPK